VNYYAGLASVMIALVYLYYSAWIFVYGGELNAAIACVREAPRGCCSDSEPHQEARLFASATVSLTTSHRRKTQALRSALASAWRKTTISSVLDASGQLSNVIELRDAAVTERHVLLLF
jgi:hypothetical protein